MENNDTLTLYGRVINLNEPAGEKESPRREIIDFIREGIVKFWPTREGFVFFAAINGKHKKLFEYKFTEFFDWGPSKKLDASRITLIHYYQRYISAGSNHVVIICMDEYLEWVDNIKNKPFSNSFNGIGYYIFSAIDLKEAHNIRCIMEYVPDGAEKIQELEEKVKALESKIKELTKIPVQSDELVFEDSFSKLAAK